MPLRTISDWFKIDIIIILFQAFLSHRSPQFTTSQSVHGHNATIQRLHWAEVVANGMFFMITKMSQDDHLKQKYHITETRNKKKEMAEKLSPLSYCSHEWFIFELGAFSETEY